MFLAMFVITGIVLFGYELAESGVSGMKKSVIVNDSSIFPFCQWKKKIKN